MPCCRVHHPDSYLLVYHAQFLRYRDDKLPHLNAKGVWEGAGVATQSRIRALAKQPKFYLGVCLGFPFLFVWLFAKFMSPTLVLYSYLIFSILALYLQHLFEPHVSATAGPDYHECLKNAVSALEAGNLKLSPCFVGAKIPRPTKAVQCLRAGVEWPKL